MHTNINHESIIRINTKKQIYIYHLFVRINTKKHIPLLSTNPNFFRLASVFYIVLSFVHRTRSQSFHFFNFFLLFLGLERMNNLIDIFIRGAALSRHCRLTCASTPDSLCQSSIEINISVQIHELGRKYTCVGQNLSKSENEPNYPAIKPLLESKICVLCDYVK